MNLESAAIVGCIMSLAMLVWFVKWVIFSAHDRLDRFESKQFYIDLFNTYYAPEIANMVDGKVFDTDDAKQVSVKHYLIARGERKILTTWIVYEDNQTSEQYRIGYRTIVYANQVDTPLMSRTLAVPFSFTYVSALELVAA